MSRIFITGDTHGQFERFSFANWPTARELTKKDYVIVCGDFGLIWEQQPDSYEKYWTEWLNNRPFTTLFIDGNHENHSRLDNYPVSNWNGGKVHFISDSIIHLMRGQIYNIDGKLFFTMGGAMSSDKDQRTPELSWWSREMPSMAEYEEAIDNLEKMHYDVDYIITHSAPTEIQRAYAYWYDFTDLNNFNQEIWMSTQFKKWFAGHFHITHEFDNRFTFVYNDIIEIKGE